MKIEVVEFDPNWKSKFDSEKKLLTDAVGSAIEQIHHIGSTSVFGLAAKPIIDIIIESPSFTELDAHRSQFENLGYEVMGEFGMSGRRYFRKGGTNRTYQIHAFVTGDVNVHRHLAFRDYLISHPDVMNQYAELKKKVAAECNQDIEVYCDGKDSFILEHEEKALKWKARI